MTNKVQKVFKVSFNSSTLMTTHYFWLQKDAIADLTKLIEENRTKYIQAASIRRVSLPDYVCPR